MKKKSNTICFDNSHNNKLNFENEAYNDFTNFLFSSFRIGQISAGITKEKLSQYDVFIIGNPYNSKLTIKEIDIIEKYVKNGGGLLVVSDENGDKGNLTNLNELTEKLGFEFSSNTISDSMLYVISQNKPIINKIELHYVTKDIQQFVYSSGCSLKIDETVKSDKNIEVNILASSGLNCYSQIYNNGDDEIDTPNSTVLVGVNYYKGRVVGIGNLSIFSSLNSNYGYSALDNSLLIANIMNWLMLAGKPADLGFDNKIISIPINYSLALWLDKMVLEDKLWLKNSDIINFSLKYFKDHYEEILEEIKEQRKKLAIARRKKTIANKKKLKDAEKERKRAMKEIEKDIYSLVEEKTDGNNEEALDDIMSELSRLGDSDEE
ncbi:MAG: hypothetical protein GY870_19480 [archaeon]|nr:hypothetical protein [archaeon]